MVVCLYIFTLARYSDSNVKYVSTKQLYSSFLPRSPRKIFQFFYIDIYICISIHVYLQQVFLRTLLLLLLLLLLQLLLLFSQPLFQLLGMVLYVSLMFPLCATVTTVYIFLFVGTYLLSFFFSVNNFCTLMSPMTSVFFFCCFCLYGWSISAYQMCRGMLITIPSLTLFAQHVVVIKKMEKGEG